MRESSGRARRSVGGVDRGPSPSAWINYLAICDGKPTSVKIDLFYEEHKRRRGLSRVVIAQLSGFEVDARGFPAKAAFNRSLYPFEDAFDKLVRRSGGALVLTTIDAQTSAYAAFLPQDA